MTATTRPQPAPDAVTAALDCYEALTQPLIHPLTDGDKRRHAENLTAARARYAAQVKALEAADVIVEYLDGFTRGNSHAEDSRKAIAAYRAAREVQP